MIDTDEKFVPVPNWHGGGVVVKSLWDGDLEAVPELLQFSPNDSADWATIRPTASFWFPVNVFLIECGGRRILVDAGAGSWASPSLGRTPEMLKVSGCNIGDINLILMTHLHPDHVTGLINAAGDPIYPNAELVVARREVDFWLRQDHSKMPARFQRNAALARRSCAPYLSRMREIEPGDKAEFGMVAVDLSGHTPGHTGWKLATPDGTLLFWGDIVHVAYPQLRLPGTTVAFDVDAVAARRTRNDLLPEAADAGFAVAGAHLPKGGIGSIERDRGGYRFVPLSPRGQET